MRQDSRSGTGPYAAAAILVLNTLLVLVALNLAAWALERLDAEESPGALVHDMAALATVYPGRSSEEIRELLSETWSRPYAYEAFTQFREPPFSGRFITVNEAGFRHGAAQVQWPPPAGARVVFVFGGSTAFGYGLPDAETIPSRLQAHLAANPACGSKVAVYNFARSNYYSSQERILFEMLASNGHVPAAVVFFDGLNEFHYFDDEPKFSARLRYLMGETDVQLWRRALLSQPIARWLLGLRRDHDQGDAALAEQDLEGVAVSILDRWRRNRGLVAAVARDSGLPAVFVAQPVPTHDYDTTHHPFWDAEAERMNRTDLLRTGYRKLASRIAAGEDTDLYWMAGMQRTSAEPLYVDRFHYTAAFSDTISSALAIEVAQQLCTPAPVSEASGVAG